MKANEERQVLMLPVEQLKTGKYQVLPARSDAEVKAFNQSIAINGVQVPIEIDEEDYVIDGHTRLEGAIAAKHTQIPCIRVVGLTEEQKRRRAYSQSNRRHLTRKQLRDLTRQALLEFHEHSNSVIASMVPQSDRTVAKVRDELILAKEIPYHPQLIGLDGKMQDAQKEPGKGGKAKKAKRPGPRPHVAGGKLEPAGDGLSITGDKVAALQMKAAKVRIFRTPISKQLLQESIDKGFACLVVPSEKQQADAAG